MFEILKKAIFETSASGLQLRKSGSEIHCVTDFCFLAAFLRRAPKRFKNLILATSGTIVVSFEGKKR